MTRLELLTLIIGRARANGFEFRRWYTARLGVPWISADAALALLDAQRRYYALVYSHEFAQTFWKAGTEITFDVPARTFQRTMPDGTIRTIERKPYMRRTVRPNAWRYHLRQMALAEEPLRYLRKYLRIEEDLDAEEPAGLSKSKPDTRGKAASRKDSTLRPMPAQLPGFLQRPYRGRAS